jgi:hypothetical protein
MRKIVGEAVHENEGRTRTVVVARVNPTLAARNVMLGESRLAVHGASSKRRLSSEPLRLDDKDRPRRGHLIG